MKQIGIIFILALILGGGVYIVIRLVSDDSNTANVEVPPVEEQILVEEVEPYIELYPDDKDRDGITDEEEASLGLDPREFDTDVDGLADQFELQTTGTDPKNRDTDGDGIGDGQEFLIWKTDPTKADTDGDGFDDPTEIENGYNPNGDGLLPAPEVTVTTSDGEVVAN